MDQKESGETPMSFRFKRPRSARIASSKVRGGACPNCHTLLDGVTGVLFDDLNFGTMPPLKGNVTMCAYCGALLRFADNQGLLRVMTEAERNAYEERIQQPGFETTKRFYEETRERARKRQPDCTKVNPKGRNN
jgi:hypothetical protein